MDSKKILAKYAKPSPLLKLLGVILLVAAVAMLAMGFVSKADAKQNAGEPEKFHALDSEDGAYAYIDVVGISNWLYKDDGAVYYVVMDRWDYVYTVRVSDSEFSKMSAQYDYYLSDDPNTPMPEAYRLCGIAKTANRTLKNTIAECNYLESYEYEDYFGTMYLNADLKPGTDVFSGWLAGCLISAVFALLFFALSLPASMQFNKCVKALEEANLLDQAAAELESGEYEKIGKDCGRMSRRFLYGKNTGFVAPYSDIQWVYRRDVKRYFVITVNVCLVVSTGKLDQRIALNYAGRNRDEELNKVFVKVHENNPDTLLGFTDECKREYKNRKKAAKIG